jgi:hypothetical protein
MRIGTRLISWIDERGENEKWQSIGNLPAQRMKLESVWKQLDDLGLFVAIF